MKKKIILVMQLFFLTSFCVWVIISSLGCGGTAATRGIGYQTPEYKPPEYKPPEYKARYDMALIAVERPADARKRYGDQKIDQVEEGKFRFYFEDELLKIMWLPSTKDVPFLLANKTDHSIKIVWDEASFIDFENKSHRIMHSGVKYADRNNSQPSTVVVRRGNLEDFLLSTDNVYFIGSSWVHSSIAPEKTENWHAKYDKNYKLVEYDEFKAMCESYKAKTFQILLPLQIQDIVNEYIFIFQIKNVYISVSD